MDLKKELKANYMKKVPKTLIVLTVISATSFFIMHNAVISKQKIKCSDNKRYVVFPPESENSHYPIQNLDRKTLLN